MQRDFWIWTLRLNETLLVKWVLMFIFLKGHSLLKVETGAEVSLCVQVVVKALQHSMTRMQVDSLDCVQFHWWDYRDKRYLDALGHLSDLQQEGLIRTYTQHIL